MLLLSHRMVGRAIAAGIARPIMDRADRDRCYVDFIHVSPQGARLLAASLLSFMSDQEPLREGLDSVAELGQP
jgi:hypothetical protein